MKEINNKTVHVMIVAKDNRFFVKGHVKGPFGNFPIANYNFASLKEAEDHIERYQ